MPELGKVYVLMSPHSERVYIGSTHNKLNVRLSHHKSHYKQYLAGNHNYVTSFELIELGDCRIYLIEEVPMDNIKCRERFYIELFGPFCVNNFKPGRTKKQYYQENIEIIRAKKAEVHVCECGREFTHSHKARHLKSNYHLNNINQM